MAVTASVHTPDGALVRTLPKLAGWQWVDALSEPGAGEVSVLADDVAVEQGNLIRFHVGDEWVFTCLVDPPSQVDLVSPRERTATLAGRGVAALLDGVRVLPETGHGWAPRERPFNWISRHFVPWGDVVWSTPATHGTAANPHNSEWEQLEAWPDIAGHAEWMQAGTPTGAGAPAYVYPPIYSYYRRTLTLNEPTDVGVFCTADDELDVYVNGHLLVRTQGTMQWRRTHTSEEGLHLPAGTHQVAIRAHNLPRPGGAHAPDSAAGVLFAACRLGSAGGPAEVLMVSQGSGWSAVGNPPHPPGMTPGRKIRLLVEEGQARGCVPAVTLDFNDEHATARPGQGLGEEWLDNVDSRVEHGRSVLDVLTAEASVSVDWHVTPDQQVRLWGRSRRYADLSGGTAPVRLEPGRDVAEMSAGPMRHRVNALQVETAEGWYTEVTDDASITEHGRIEGFRRLGEQDLPDSARGPAEEVVADSGDPQPVATVLLSPGCRYMPYRDFQVGDRVSAPGPVGTWATWRVLAVRCRHAEDWRPEWTLTVELVA